MMSNSVLRPSISCWCSRKDKSEDPRMRVWRSRRQWHRAGPKISVWGMTEIMMGNHSCSLITWDIIFFRMLASRKAIAMLSIKWAYNTIIGVGDNIFHVFCDADSSISVPDILEFSLMLSRVQDVCCRFLTFNIVSQQSQTYFDLRGLLWG